jgi:8-oxo-dGTP pyrophosphatase MutT (NUDIX family)
MKKFNNVSNRQIIDESGKTHWISRSVVTICLIKCQDKFLIIKRGPYVTQTGKWCLPCGYLDWNETVEECAIREVYEESGLDLTKYLDAKDLKPYRISSDPGSSKMENISVEYFIDLGDIDFPETSIIDPKETLDIDWVSRNDIDRYDFAFNHDNKIISDVGDDLINRIKKCKDEVIEDIKMAMESPLIVSRDDINKQAYLVMSNINATKIMTNISDSNHETLMKSFFTLQGMFNEYLKQSGIDQNYN